MKRTGSVLSKGASEARDYCEADRSAEGARRWQPEGLADEVLALRYICRVLCLRYLGTNHIFTLHSSLFTLARRHVWRRALRPQSVPETKIRPSIGTAFRSSLYLPLWGRRRPAASFAGLARIEYGTRKRHFGRDIHGCGRLCLVSRRKICYDMHTVQSTADPEGDGRAKG